MGKSIKTGIAAAAMCLTLVGCQKYDFTPISEGEAAYVNYENAFIEKFGEPAPDQTWGFGSTNVAKSGMTRAITPTYSFPNDADASKFLTAVPEGVEMYKGYNQLVSYVDETFTGKDLQIQGVWSTEGTKTNTLYVKGNVDFSSINFYAANGAEIYILEGSILKLPVDGNNTTNIQQNVKIYLAKDAKLKTTGELKINSASVYSHGAIEAKKIDINGTGVLYNTGNVNVVESITIGNGESVLVNDGTLTGASLQTAGSGKVQNNGTATISGETLVDSNNNTWVNNGQYNTGYFKFNAMSDQVINNCRLNVSETFSVTLGDGVGGIFRMDGAAGVVAKNFKAAGPFRIEMGGKSVFKVTETAVFDAAKANYGVYGIGNDYAVFHANKIEAGSANQGYEVTYGGNLYVVANTTHFENGFSGAYPYIDFKDGCTENNIYENGNVPAITINETNCNPGFKGNSTGSSPTPIRIIAEDLSASEGSDFDFNDVVFDVQLNWPEQGLHTITLLAAGGTLPLTVGGEEVHAKFGVETGKMVNTAGWTAKIDPVTFIVYGNYSNANEIEVRVKKGNDWPLLTAEQGKAASKIAVPNTYKWCEELKDIEEVYPDFKDYVNNPQLKWWETPVENAAVYNK